VEFPIILVTRAHFFTFGDFKYFCDYLNFKVPYLKLRIFNNITIKSTNNAAFFIIEQNLIKIDEENLSFCAHLSISENDCLKIKKLVF